MNRIASLLSRAVLTLPVLIITAALALTGVFGYLSGQAEFATGNESFAPDNPELLAMETIGERFNGSGETVLQVLVDGEDVISADGLVAAERITAAIRDSVPEHYLADTPDRPAVVHWLLPVQQGLAEQGIAAAGVDDAQVDETFLQAFEGMPEDQAGFVTGLLPDDAALASSPASSSGLVLVFLHLDEVAPDTLSENERWDAMSATDGAIAEAVRSVDLPDGIDAEAFSFALMFGEDEEAFQAELGRLFGTAFLIILVILGFVYWVKPGAGSRVIIGTRRTVADVLLTMLTIVMAIVWMNGIAVLLGPGYLGWIGPLNDVSQVVPVLLIGLGVDYAIHLTSRYREEVAAGGNVAEAISRSVHTVGIALVLATVTTAVGFLTNVFNPVPALVDFGVTAAVGIVAAFLLMLTFLPSARLLIDRRAERKGVLPRQALGRTSERLLPGIMSRVAVLAERAPIPTVVVTVLLGGALGAWGLSQLEVRFSVTDFVEGDSPAVAVYEEIVDRFDGGFGETTQVLVTGDVATPEVHNALVASLDDLAGVPDVATFGDAAQADSPVGLLGLALAPPDGSAPPQPLVAAADAAGVGADLTVADDADVAALYDALLAAAPEQAERQLARDADGTFDALRVSVQTNGGEAGAAALRTNLDQAFAPVVAAGAEVTPTSDEIITDVVVTALSDSQVSSMAITLIAAMLLLMATYWFRNRRPALGVITVIPVALVVLWTFAMMAATDIPFGPITATIAALAIGIGVPYTIHITNRYQEDRMVHADPAEAIRSTVRHTGGALAGSAFTTCAGFGILITSTLTPFRQFGFVTAYAIGFALLAATLVLPSMLELWDRWHRRRRPAEPEVAQEVPARL